MLDDTGAKIMLGRASEDRRKKLAESHCLV